MAPAHPHAPSLPTPGAPPLTRSSRPTRPPSGQGHAPVHARAPAAPVIHGGHGAPPGVPVGRGAPAAPPVRPPAASPVAASPVVASAGVAAAGVPPAMASAPSHVPDTDDHNLPQTFFLGRYRVVDEIGVGGMASVHLARVDGPGGFQKWVAIKRIHPHLVEDDQFVDMFLDEARIAAGINHANVAQVFDLGKDDNTYWIAMEYLHGEPLREVMRRVEERGRRVPFHLAARICADAAEGLHGAHELRGRNGQLLNLVHRDVTPHNLFVTYEGYTKVVDFGIAKVVDRLASTRAGTLKGKLAYMSPEQVRGQEVDRRTDIFALGVVLWELTTNRRLFRMDTDLDTLEKVQACVVPLPSTIVGDYPPDLEAVVMKTLSQRREDRYQTARALSRALQGFLMKQGVFVGPEDVGDTLKSLFDDRVRKREKYLEWAAEVTSTVDVEQLRAQQSAADQAAPNPVADGSAVPHGSAPSESRVQERNQAPQQYGSSGQNSASAAMVTSAPVHPQPQTELASSSLMDEDEDIPTVVAQPRGEPAPTPSGPRPAAGMPAVGQGWDGASTQMLGSEHAEDGLEATIALPDEKAAQQIRAKIDELNRSPAPPPTPQRQQPPMGAQREMTPTSPGVPPPPGPGYNQHAIETRMNLPRPAAVAQWLAEQGDIQIQGPRSTGVLMAIALLSTLCVIGVGALVVFKLRAAPRQLGMSAAPTPSALVSTDNSKDNGASKAEPAKTKKTSGGSKADSDDDASSSGDDDDSADASKKKSGGKQASAGSTPGKLTINCKPACDQVTAAGRSLGPSPVVSHSMRPGQHRVTLKRGSKSKTIVVSIESGQLTSQTVSMK